MLGAIARGPGLLVPAAVLVVAAAVLVVPAAVVAAAAPAVSLAVTGLVALAVTGRLDIVPLRAALAAGIAHARHRGRGLGAARGAVTAPDARGGRAAVR